MKTLTLIIGLSFLLIGCEKTEIGEQHNYKYLGSPGHYIIKFTTHKENIFEVKGDTFIYEFTGDKTPLNIEIIENLSGNPITVYAVEDEKSLYTKTKRGNSRLPSNQIKHEKNIN